MFKDWLSQSGINESTQEMFGLGVGKHFMLGTCIVIPVFDTEGNFSFNKYRKNPTVEDKHPKYMYDKGGSVSLYGYHRAKGHDTILVTEGEKDCLVAWSNNIPAVTSTGGSLSFQQDWEELFAGKEVIFCFDNDEAGGVGMVRALKILPNAKVMFLPDRPGIKDISDYVMGGGDLHTLLKTAVHFGGLDDVYEDRGEKKALWKNTFFHDAYIKEHTKPRLKVGTSVKYEGDEVTTVKQLPIDSITKFTSNKACCLWHNEKTPSMVYYPKTNSVYCFGCGKYGDTIDVYKQVHSCDFKTALKELKKLL